MSRTDCRERSRSRWRSDPAVIRDIKDGPTARYFAEYDRANALLGRLGEQIARILIDAGYRARPFAATTEQIDRTTLSLKLQHKTVATRAGLGWIGKSGLLVTKEYGSAVRLASVLTDAEFETGTPTDASRLWGLSPVRRALPGPGHHGCGIGNRVSPESISTVRRRVSRWRGSSRDAPESRQRSAASASTPVPGRSGILHVSQNNPRPTSSPPRAEDLAAAQRAFPGVRGELAV